MPHSVAVRQAGLRPEQVPGGRRAAPPAAAPGAAGHALKLQRSVGNQAVLSALGCHPVPTGLATAGDVARSLGSGRPLDPADRVPAEAAAGADLSRVRIHQGAAAARLCRSLGARAFTLGTDVAFADGAYAPGTAAGRRLLGHELAHVVQQGNAPAPDGHRLDVGAATDPAEREADAFAGQGGDLAARRPATVQRYLAGSEGHGGIERNALQQAGLSPADAKLAYYGNWLRDLSQLGDGGAIHEVIRVLATGEFGRTPTDEEIGHYLASEHLDRPDGGQTAEDPRLLPGVQQAKTRALTGEQRRWAEEEQTARFGDLIQRRAAVSGLPHWIEAGKEHAKRKLAEAVALGHTPAGLMAMGNGLHAVEDYFAHSNFVEVALARLAEEGRLAPGHPLLAAMGRYPGVDPARVRDRPGGPVTDRFGRPRIVTGTSVGWGGNLVGLWESIKTEIQTGELRAAFAKGLAIRYGWQGAGGAGRFVLGGVAGAVGAAVGFIGGGLRWAGGTLAGLAAGAGSGAVSAWRSARHWWEKPFAALGGLVGGAVLGAALGAGTTAGPLAGAASGWRAGERVGGAIGQVVFGGPAAGVAGAAGATLTLVGSELLAAVDLAVGREIIPFGTRAAIKAAPYRTGPTHSQIAKDDPEHPLHAASRALAAEADLHIGRAVLDAWAGTGPAADPEARVRALVDVYVAHPYAVTWWQSVLSQAARPAPRPNR